jgi:hypothetical protein
MNARAIAIARAILLRMVLRPGETLIPHRSCPARTRGIRLPEDSRQSRRPGQR